VLRALWATPPQADAPFRALAAEARRLKGAAALAEKRLRTARP
jgi:hypothetical protein